MNNELIRSALTLARRDVQRLEGVPGRRIECLTGALWITQDNDLRDIVIEAGEGFSLDRHGAALVSALSDARYLLLCDEGWTAAKPLRGPTAARIGRTLSARASERGRDDDSTPLATRRRSPFTRLFAR